LSGSLILRLAVSGSFGMIMYQWECACRACTVEVAVMQLYSCS